MANVLEKYRLRDKECIRSSVRISLLFHVKKYISKTYIHFLASTLASAVPMELLTIASIHTSMSDGISFRKY